MKRISLTRTRGLAVLAGLVVFAAVSPSAARSQELKVEEHVLSNGMKLLLVPRRDEPVVSAGWVAKVGSANERPGITGISHLFEHMMFKGTEAIGSKDYARDQKLIAEQERLRGLMRDEESKMRAALRRGEIDDVTKPESKTPRYKELEKEFDALVKEQRDLLVKNEFDRIYTKQGASGMNASTNSDLTQYFITVPKNKLELWMWMESDRLKGPVFREFYSERDVVFEERRLRTESTPTGRLDEAFEEMFWHGHPYTWPVLGYASDIPAITKADADAYYALFYAPNNITAVLVGDFDPKEAAATAERYFGRIPRGKNPPPEMTILPPKWEAEMRFNGEADTNPQVSVGWHTVPFQNKDAYPLQVLAQLLNGRTGRLYKAMVVGDAAVATNVTAGASSRKYAGEFGVEAEVKEGRTPEDAEKAIYVELEKLKKDLVPAEELQKVKNNFAAQTFRSLQANFQILFQLMGNEGRGDWKEFNRGPKKIQAVTAEDVRRVARTYLTKENRGVATYTRRVGAPGAAAAPEDPALAAVPEQMRPMVKQTIARLAASTDADKLKQMIAQMESQSGQMPPQMKPATDLILQKARERLTELEKTPKTTEKK
ncbi:MAG: insulinase family protein [Thermoanaerobaculia bacterium]|nr:insulinase family protein [Thermoanaerobaculia bacterium]